MMGLLGQGHDHGELGMVFGFSWAKDMITGSSEWYHELHHIKNIQRVEMLNYED